MWNKKVKKHGSELPRAEPWFHLPTGVGVSHSPSFPSKVWVEEIHSWLERCSPLGKSRASLKTWFLNFQSHKSRWDMVYCHLTMTIFFLSCLAFLVEMKYESTKPQTDCLYLLVNKYLAIRDYYMSAKKSIFSWCHKSNLPEYLFFFFSELWCLIILRKCGKELSCVLCLVKNH